MAVSSASGFLFQPFEESPQSGQREAIPFPVGRLVGADYVGESGDGNPGAAYRNPDGSPGQIRITLPTRGLECEGRGRRAVWSG